MQVGAFYPFARDHSDKSSSRQELYLWDSVAASAKKALSLRYQLLPYFYTLMYNANAKGIPIARPLFFTFPEDANTYGISSQFLLGERVLVSPVLQQGAVSVNAYFPAGNWFNLFNHTNSISLKQGQYVELDAPADSINVHVAGGSIIAMQGEAMTTNEARATPFHLLVAMAEGGNSSGEVFLDDGEDLAFAGEGGRWSLVCFNGGFEGGKVVIESRVVNGDYALSQNWTIGSATILGVRGNGTQGCGVGGDSNGFVTLELSNLSLPIGKDFKIEADPCPKMKKKKNSVYDWLRG